MKKSWDLHVCGVTEKSRPLISNWDIEKERFYECDKLVFRLVEICGRFEKDSFVIRSLVEIKHIRSSAHCGNRNRHGVHFPGLGPHFPLENFSLENEDFFPVDKKVECTRNLSVCGEGKKILLYQVCIDSGQRFSDLRSDYKGIVS